MADHYEDYTREQLMRLLRECDKRPGNSLYGVVTSREKPHMAEIETHSVTSNCWLVELMGQPQDVVRPRA